MLVLDEKKVSHTIDKRLAGFHCITTCGERVSLDYQVEDTEPLTCDACKAAPAK